tara:strand:- start:6513 stop:8084 length:1572 start_codon:yes stop_codon:yes gene_type:complete
VNANRTDENPIEDVPDPRRWLILLVMTGSLAMVMLDTTIVAVSLPSIQANLPGVSQNVLEWVIVAYMVVLASFMALGGHLGDLFGKPRMFFIGVLGFGVSSFLCGLAWNGSSLIIFRVIQGLFAVIMQPASSAIVIGSFAPQDRGKAMAVYAGIPLLFLTAGPVLGGVITEYASWRYCFLINVPIAVTVAIAVLILRPGNPMSRRGAFDWWGAILLGTGLPSLIIPIQQSSVWGWESPWTIGVIILGLMILTIFVWRELKVDDPIISLRLFADKVFLGDAILLFITQASVTGITIFIAIHLQVVMGFTPDQAGLAMLPVLVPAAVMIHFAGRWYDRSGGRRPVAVGGVIVTAGLGVLATGTGMQIYLVMAIGLGMIGMGIPFVQLPANTDGMGRVDSRKRGMASGVLQTCRQFGAAIGIAVMGAVIAGVQNGLMKKEDAGSGPGDGEQLSLAREAARGELPKLEALRETDPELAVVIANIVSDGIVAGLWVATIMASSIIIIAFVFLETTAVSMKKSVTRNSS